MRLSRRPLPGLLAALAAAAALAGCGDERFQAELASELYAAPVRAPVAREVRAGPLAGDGGRRAPAAREIGAPQRLFSVGARDGDERYVFGRIADVALGGAGDTVFVLDALERRVKAFSRDGRFLYHFGQKGKGPGEYEDPVSVVRLPWSGALAVWDAALQRLTVATPTGEVLHTHHPLRQSDIARTGKKLRAYGGGFVLEVRSDVYTVDPSRQRGYLVRLDTLGQVRDTLLDFAVPPIRGSTQQGSQGMMSATELYPPTWTPEPRWDLSPAGEVVFAPGGNYEVYRFAVGGPVTRVSREVEHRKVTRPERMANLRGYRERGQLPGPLPLSAHELIQRKSGYARVRPALSGVLAGDGGAFWARRFDALDHWQGLSWTWDTYTPGGGAAETLRFPAGFHPLVARGGRVFGVRSDGLDVDYLEGYRL